MFQNLKWWNANIPPVLQTSNYLYFSFVWAALPKQQCSIDMGRGKCKEIIGERAWTNFTKIFKPRNGVPEMKLNHETCCSTYYQQVKELKYYAFYSIHYSNKYLKICNMVHIHKLNNRRGPQKNKKKSIITMNQRLTQNCCYSQLLVPVDPQKLR